MSNITIISDGTSLGTKVMVNDKFIKGITGVKINEIKPDGFVTATLTIDKVALQMALNDVNVECEDLDFKAKIEDALKNTQPF